MIETSIIIPTDTRWLRLSQCVEGIVKNTNNYEIIFIVDNNIALRQIDSTLRTYGKVIFQVPPFNFSQRVNAGIREAKGEYICILNDDTIPQKNWLEKMIATNRWFGPGLVGARCQDSGCSNPDAHGAYPKRHTDYTINMFAMLIPRRVINVMGLLDERFAYYGGEDDDYCLRALRHGFELMISDGYVHHKKSQLFDKEKQKELLPKTREVFIRKWGVDMPRPPKENWRDNVRGALTKPLISVLMPTRDHEAYIKKAIESVLSQTYSNLKLIIGFDGYGDHGEEKTERIINEFKDQRIEVIASITQVGSCKTRNLLFTRSGGEFIALMDSDDVMLPHRLESELATMAPDIDIVHSGYIEEKEDGSHRIPFTYPINRRVLLSRRSYIAGGTFLMRRFTLAEEKFNEKYARAFDFEYALRTYEKFKYKYLDEPTIIYRRHPGPHLSGNKESRAVHDELIRKYR